MTKYHEIIRLDVLSFSAQNIVLSCKVSRNTVLKVLRYALEQNTSWPLDDTFTEEKLEKLLFSWTFQTTTRRLPDYRHIRKKLMKNSVNRKLL